MRKTYTVRRPDYGYFPHGFMPGQTRYIDFTNKRQAVAYAKKNGLICHDTDPDPYNYGDNKIEYDCLYDPAATKTTGGSK